MNNFIESVNDALGPIASNALGHALIGLVILIVGLILVKFISGLFKRLLTASDFLKTHKLTTPISSLIKAVLTVFVLVAVLQHFGLTNVLEPLATMLNQFLGAVPRIIGAGVVGYAGWIIAKIVSELVGIALAKVDTQIAERTSNDDIKIAPFASAFIFAGILLPIVVAALGVLNIPAITVPASDMINELMAVVPNIVGAGIILLVTFFVAKFVVYIVNGLLSGMQIDSIPVKLGIQKIFTPNFTLTRLIGGAIMFFSMLTASIAAVDTLGIETISNIFSRILEFGGGILVGCVILVIGNFLGNLAYQKLIASGNPSMAGIARIAILGLVLAMGLRSMGLAENIVNIAFACTLGAVAVAIALAFGLGSRDAAKTIADSWAEKITKK